MPSVLTTVGYAEALLDQAPKPSASPTESNAVGAYHLVGGRLLRSATSAGVGQIRSAAAVEVFRRAVEDFPDDPSLHNALGASLLAAARFASEVHSRAQLIEAVNEFQAARSGAKRQSAPHVVHFRYSVNLATARWMLGERTQDVRAISKAVAALQSMASELPTASPYQAHVLNNLGNALMAQGRVTDALTAYSAALDGRPAAQERARILNNLGTAYAALGKPTLARKCHRQSLELQPRDQFPLGWGLAQHNLGTVYLTSALAGRQRTRAARQLTAAIEAFERALEVRVRQYTPQDWAATNVNLADALLALGAERSPRQGHGAGIELIRSAIGRYKDALPELTAADVDKTLQNLRIAWQVLERVLGVHEAHGEIHRDQRDVLTFALHSGRAEMTPAFAALAEEAEWPQAGTPGHDGLETLPPGLEWPTETYGHAHKVRKENVVQFLMRVWLPLVKVGVVDLRTLRARDPSAAKAIDNFRQGVDPATGLRRQLPRELDIPTKKQLNDRLAERLSRPGDRPARLDWALRARKRRNGATS